MASAHSHPRRRAQNTLDTTLTCPPLPSLEPKQRQEAIKAMSLRKGSTFHSPKLPSSPVDDPVLDVRGVPLRSPTCPESLEDLVAASETRIASLLENIDRSLAGQDTKGLEQADTFPVPRFLVAHASIGPDMDKKVKKDPRTSNHASDSGLGTSVSSVSDSDQRSTAERLRLATRSVRSRSSVYSPTRQARVASESTASSSVAGDEKLFLSAHATKKIKEFIIDPILAEDRLKDYHKLVGGVPHRIGQRNITCLRDLEKTLIFLAPSKAKSAASYLQFCETSIQCIHTTVDHLNDQDQRRPTDRPYTNNYFLDLIQQVRQYARIMAASKQKLAEGKTLGKDDYSPEEKLRLRGGMSEDGKPAELVREKDGKTIPIEAEPMELEDDDEDDPERSMARKRKCDIGKEVWRACRECGKQFKRPCDLTKHEKTHSRPWKCPVENCKYHTLGWPTEKECDRHVNDKHTSTPALYQCLYDGCTYTSKRESNCKQHMEKTHGYDYIRSKSKKAARLLPTAQGQSPDGSASAMLTPSSAFQSIPSPGSNFTSPLMRQHNELSPPTTDEAASPFSGNGTIATGSMSLFENNVDMMGQGNNFTNFGFNEMQQQSNAVTPQGSAAHSESMGTPNTNFTISDIDPTLPEDAWNMQFDFGELANDDGFPTPEEFFNQYANGQGDPVQQPTPAMSDFDFSKSPDGQKPMTAAAQQQNPMLHQQDSLPSNALGGGDFSLFGEQGESSSMAHIFSDLTGNGGQFDNTFDLDADFKPAF